MAKLNAIFFLTLIVLIPLGYSADVLDNALIPKFCYLSLGLLAFYLAYFKKLYVLPFKINWFDLFLLAYLSLSFISIFQAINKPETLYESLKIVLFVAAYYMSLFLINEDRDLAFQKIAIAACIATFLAFSFSINELIDAAKSRLPFKDTSYLINGLSGHRNLLSSWFLLLIPLNALGFWYKPKWPRILFMLALIIQLIYIFCLQTRAVYSAILIGFVSFYFLLQLNKANDKWQKVLKNSLKLILAVLGSILCIILLLVFFDKFPTLIEFKPESSSSVKERIIVWSKTITMIKEHFFLGVGAGNWKINFPNQILDGLYRTTQGNIVFARPHNDYLWLWVELGCFGLLAFLAFVFTSLKSAYNSITNLKTTNYASILASSGMLVYLIVSLFDFPRERIEHSLVFFLYMAIINSSKETKPLTINFKVKSLYPVVLVLLTFSFYVGYKRYTSEVEIRKALVFKDEQNYSASLAAIQYAKNSFIVSDNNAVPLVWYEGIANYNMQKQNLAFENFINAYELNPYNYNVIGNVGTVYFQRQDFDTAEKYYLEALRINPKFNDALLNIAAVYIQKENKSLANEYLNRVRVNSARLQNLRTAAQ